MVLLAATIPALIALFAMGEAVSVAALDAYADPDAGTSFWLLIAQRVWPLLLVVVLAICAGQAVGARALRRTSLGNATRDVSRRPVTLIGQAGVTFTVILAAQLLSIAILGVLWAPIGPRLAEGQLGEPTTWVLLVGFVAAWLCLLLIAGAVQAWSAAWWSLEAESVTGG